MARHTPPPHSRLKDEEKPASLLSHPDRLCAPLPRSGFDAVSTTAQECKNPQRDLPLGTLLSLGICTALYIVVSLLVTGLVPYTEVLRLI